MHYLIDRIPHTTVFVKPVMEHWLERELLYGSTTVKTSHTIACFLFCFLFFVGFVYLLFLCFFFLLPFFWGVVEGGVCVWEGERHFDLGCLLTCLFVLWCVCVFVAVVVVVFVVVVVVAVVVVNRHTIHTDLRPQNEMQNSFDTTLYFVTFYSVQAIRITIQSKNLMIQML